MIQSFKDNMNIITTVGSVVVATFYLEDRINNTITKANEHIEVQVGVLNSKVQVLEDNALIYNFKIDAYEKYFNKPKEPKLENADKES